MTAAPKPANEAINPTLDGEVLQKKIDHSGIPNIQ
jgi:hypothetical protein